MTDDEYNAYIKKALSRSPESQNMSFDEQVDNMMRLLQNAVNPVENRKEKNEIVSKLLKEIMKDFFSCPVIKKLKWRKYFIHRINITEKYSELGLSDKYYTKINEHDMVYFSKLNEEKFFFFTQNDLLSEFGFEDSSVGINFFEKVIAQNFEDAFIKVCSKRKSDGIKITNEKVAVFIGKKSEYLKYDIQELGCYVSFQLYKDTIGFSNNYGFWISNNFINQLSLF